MSIEQYKGKENQANLDFFHEGEKYSIPLATSAKELWPLLHKRIIPGLEELKAEKADQLDDLEIGLCLAWFVQEGEDLEDKNPEVAEAIKGALKKAGVRIPDITKKDNRFGMSRGSFLDRIRENPADYYTAEYFNRIYVLAPAFALAYTEDNFKDQMDHPEKYKIELLLNSGVAIRFSDLIKGKDLRVPGTIYNDELMSIIDRLIKIKPT